MMYSLKRIFHNIRRRIGVYLIFILEFAVGIAVLSSTLNILYSLNEDLAVAREKMMSKTIEIVAKNTSWSPSDFKNEIFIKPWEEDIDVSYDLYLKLQQTYGRDLNISYALRYFSWEQIYYGNKSNNIKSLFYNVYFVNGAKFRELFNTDMEPGKIYAGEKAYAFLNEYIDYHSDSGYHFMSEEKNYPPLFTVENGELILSGKNKCELVPSPPTDKEFYMEKPDIEKDSLPKLSECVFIPVEEFKNYRDLVRKNFNPYNGYYTNYRKTDHGDSGYSQTKTLVNPGPMILSDLSVEYNTDNADIDLIPSFLSFLNSHTNEREFSMSRELLNLQLQADSINMTVVLQIIRSSAVMLIVVLGTTGLLLIFLYQRKKQMAVSIAYGATKARLFGEIFTEIFLITGLGTALGLFALKYTMPRAIEIYGSTTFQPACIIIPVITAVVCSLLTASLAFAGIGEISPARILKDL